jgi:hypothetical protein
LRPVRRTRSAIFATVPTVPIVLTTVADRSDFYHNSTPPTVVVGVLLHNGGFCNGCITKRILLLQAFHSLENQYYADYDKKYYNFSLFNLLHIREKF